MSDTMQNFIPWLISLLAVGAVMYGELEVLKSSADSEGGDAKILHEKHAKHILENHDSIIRLQKDMECQTK